MSVFGGFSMVIKWSWTGHFRPETLDQSFLTKNGPSRKATFSRGHMVLDIWPLEMHFDAF